MNLTSTNTLSATTSTTIGSTPTSYMQSPNASTNVKNYTNWALSSFSYGIRWHYFLKGVPHIGKKEVWISGNDAYLSKMVAEISAFIEENTIPGETLNARLVISKRGLFSNVQNAQPETVQIYDLFCPVRLMRKIKKYFKLING